MSEDKSVPVAKIDLAKYRTSGLIERLIEILSVPQAFRRVALTSIALAFIVLIGAAAIFVYSEISGMGWLMVCVYALVVGWILGIALGLLRVVAAALNNIELILQMLLEVTEKVAADYVALQSGEARLPTGGELLEQVYAEIFMPAMEKVVAGTLGPLGRPLLWVYRRTIGSAVRFVVKKMNRMGISRIDADELKKKVEFEMKSTASYSESIHRYCTAAAGLVAKVGSKSRWYALLPLYIAFFVSLGLALIPILVYRFFVDG